MTKFGPNGDVVYSTLLAHRLIRGRRGSRPHDTSGADERGRDIAVDATGRAYVVGMTTAGCPGAGPVAGYPTTEGAFQRAVSDQAVGCWDYGVAFVSVLSADGSQLESSTLLGSDRAVDEAFGVALDSRNHVFVTGSTSGADFPTVRATQQQLAPGICQTNRFANPPFNIGCSDLFVTEFDPFLSTVLFSTYLGGSGDETEFPEGVSWRDYGRDGGRGIAVDAFDNIYVAGWARSADVPVFEAFQDSLRGEIDGLVAKWDADRNLVYATYLGGLGWDQANAILADSLGRAFVVGWTQMIQSDPDFPVADALQPDFGGIYDGFLSVFGEAGLAMNPEGVGYDPENPDPGVTDRMQSTYTDLKIVGEDLQDVAEVIFKLDGQRDLDLQVKNVRSSESEITYDLELVHGLELGEREIFLKWGDGREEDITGRVDKGFLVTQIGIALNQAVDDRSLDTEAYRQVQVARKHGVLNVWFVDDDRIGESYRGELRVGGQSGLSQSVQPHPVLAEYTDQDILDGRHILTMPFPGTDGFSEGEHVFSCDLHSSKWHIRCPEVSRTFYRSIPIDIAAISFVIDKSDGTRLTTQYTPEEAETEILAYLKKLFPVSGDAIQFTHLATYEFPALWRGLFDDDADEFPEDGQRLLDAFLRSFLQTHNNERLKNGENRRQALLALMPPDILGSTLAYAIQSNCTIVMATPLDRLGAFVVHELGHVIDSCLRRGSGAFDLGDEYRGGQFECNLNPPVFPLDGVRYVRNATGGWDELTDSCPLSPLQVDVDGDFVGTYTSFSAYDPVEHKTKFHWTAGAATGPSRRSQNYMSGGLRGAEYWVSSRVYDLTHPVFLSALVAEKTAQRLLEIAGWVRLDGTAGFTGVRIVEDGEMTENEPGPYTLELQDRPGNVLEEHKFEVSPIKLTNPPRQSDQVYFRVRMPDVAGARRLILRFDGVEVARQEFSDRSPVVLIKSPGRDTQISGIVDVAWQATDADGDSLTYSVLFSPDGGHQAIPVGVDLQNPSFRLNTTSFGPLSNPWIKVVATDGYNVGEARVSPGVDSNPRINGLTPMRGIQGDTDFALSLSGSGFSDGAGLEIIGGGVSADSVVWISPSRMLAWVSIEDDADLGGRDVVVTNPDGQTATGLGLFEVVETATVDVRLRWSPPATDVDLAPPRNLSAEVAGAALLKARQVLKTTLDKSAGSPHRQVITPVSPATTVIPEVEPNDTVDEAQVLLGPGPVHVRGSAETGDEGELFVEFQSGATDDIEDLFRFTTLSEGLTVTLDSFSIDCDVYLLDETGLNAINAGLAASDTGPEIIDEPTLAPGTYLVGVSLFETPTDTSTEYTLTLEGDLQEPAQAVNLQGYRVYRSSSADAMTTGTRIADIEVGTPAADPEIWIDQAAPRRRMFYEVTAVYETGESPASNEVEVDPAGQTTNDAPEILEPIGDMTLLVGTDPFVRNLLFVFDEPDGETLTYMADSDDPSVVTAGIDSNELTLLATASGDARITVIAEDPLGARAANTFTVTVPTGVEVESEAIPKTLELHANYPNPFQMETTIRLDLPGSEVVLLEAFDLLGRRVARLANQRMPAGTHTITWNGLADTGVAVPSGVYVYRLKAGAIERSRMMIVVR